MLSQTNRYLSHLRSVVTSYLLSPVSLFFVFTSLKTFQSMRIRCIYISLMAAIFPSTLLYAQSCGKGEDAQPLKIEFKSQYLQRELSGFFPYAAGAIDPNASTLTKYLVETWTGGGSYHSRAEGCAQDFWDLEYAGAWSFSAVSFTDLSTKSIIGWNTGCYNTNEAFERYALKAGIGWPFGGGSWGVIYGPIPEVQVASPVSRSLVYAGGQYATDWWDPVNQTETLSVPFTVEAAIARADRPENIRPQDIGTSSAQYWNNYSPATMGEVTSRTQPVAFHGQRVGFKLTLPATPCDGDYKLVLEFKDWAYGETEPKVPTKTFVSSGFIPLDKDKPTYWPAGSEYRTYEEMGLPMVQGRRSILVSAKLINADACAQLPLGSATFELGSVDFSLSLGRFDSKRSAGVLSLVSPKITTALFTPKALQVTAHPSAVVIRDSNQAIRQISAPELFVDIVTLTSVSFEVRSYLPTQVGEPDSVTGIRPLTGTPLNSYTFAGEVAGALSSLTITPADIPARAATYTYDATTGTMSMAQLAADRVESVTSTTTGTTTPVTTEVRTVKNTTGTLISQRTTAYTSYPFGRVVTTVTNGAGAAAEATGTIYYTTPADTANYGRIQQVTQPSGAWTRYTYDAQGRVLTETSRYLNIVDGTTASNRLTTTTYGTLADQDGDSLAEELITRVEKTSNVETARSYELNFTAPETYNGLPTKRTHSIQTAAPGGTWNDPANLVSVFRTVSTGSYADKPASSLSAEGLLTTYAYATDSGTGALTTTVDSGAPNPGLTAVIAGTRSVSSTDTFGRTLEQTTTDIATSTLLELSVVTTRDVNGRPTRIDYADDTFELRSYACCGLSSETDRQGVTTTYQYDPLGRLERTSRAGATTRYTYDAAGNRLKTIRIGTDNSEITVSENSYDTAGRLVTSTDALARSTTITYANLAGGGTRTTTVAPGGGTRIETTVADGSLLKVEGAAVPWRTYAYVINANGTTTTTEYAPAALITDTAAWRRTTSDFLGRVVSESFPDGAAGNLFYNSLGQLIRQTDPDGVQTLFAYDAQGRRTVTALDVDRDGVIDYDGTDRVTRSVTTYATRSGTPVSRTTAEIWETDNANTPFTVSTTDTTLDGRQTWQTVRGLTTHTVTTYSPTGNRTTVTTAPDGTVQTSVALNGRPDTSVISHPSLGTLSTTSYHYDPHGRLGSQITATGTTTYTYFADDQVETVTTPDPDTGRSGPGYDPQVTTYRYNSAGRVDRVTHPDATETFTTYTPAGQVLRVWGSRTYPQGYTYDAQQRVKTLTTWQDYAGQTGAAVTTWNYHTQRGWLLNKRYTDGTGPAYTYKLSGRLLTRTWARSSSLVTTYAYNNAGDLSSLDYSDTTPDVAYTYDRIGRPLTTTDAAGLLTRSYENGRLDDEIYTGTGLLSGQSLTRTQDGQQRPATLVATAVPSVAYGYDAVSRLGTVTQGTRVATQTYHATRSFPEVVSIAHSGTPRLTATRTLDNLGRISSAVTPGLTSIAYDYNSANQRIKATNALDGSYWDYGYDALGQVTSAVKREAAATVRPGHTFGYAFDDIGNRKQATLNNLTSIYATDLKNQYLSRTTPPAIPVLGTATAGVTVKVNGETPVNRVGGWFYHELALDGSGAPQYLQFPVSATTLQGTPPTSELVRSDVRQAYVPASPEVMAHDADGNLTQDGRWTYTWDAENRLIKAETRADMATAAPGLTRQRLIFTYDGNGRRIGKKVETWSPLTSTYALNSETKFLYDGWNLVAEYNALAGNALVCSHTWGLDVSGTPQGAGGVGGLLWTDLKLSTSTSPAGVYAPAYDGNGNITAWVDLVAGGKIAEIDYDAFGNPIPVTGTSPTPFGFSTKYLDGETGLNYYGLRYYNPQTGRWLSKDPIEERGGLNLYGMVGNDPINYMDYLGLEGRSPYCDCILKSFLENNLLLSLAGNRLVQIEEAYENTLRQIKTGLRDPSQIKLALLTNGSVPILTRVDGSIVDAASVVDALLKLTGNPAEKFGSMVGYQSLAVDSGNLAIDIVNGDPSASLSGVKLGYTVGTTALTGIIFKEAVGAFGKSKGSVVTGIVALPLAGFGIAIDAIRDDYSYNEAVKALDAVRSQARGELKLQIQIYSSAAQRDLRHLKEYKCLE